MKGIRIMAKKKIICVVGRTATGKTSLARAVCNKLGIKIVKSYTTRPIRPKEIENHERSDHYFITDEDVDTYRDDIAAYTEINGYKYFTTKQVLNESDVYVIDPLGIKELKRRCGDEYQIITVYIRVDHSTGKRRAMQRGESIDDYYERYKSENEQFSNFEKEMSWDYHILNIGTFEDAANTMEKIIRKELNMYD